MKKAFLISALAVALVSCGGNSNQNQGGAQSADSTNAQNIESQPSASPINVGDIEGYPANEVSKILNCADDEEWCSVSCLCSASFLSMSQSPR